ncbi:hypothetical protein H0A71_06580 [Alcaligenaceae bacterium]|nr:hypothetical protein [Alcaligenaceae bacterium]
MRREPKTLVPGSTLGTSAAVLYSVPAGTVTTISAMTVTNTTVGVEDVTVYLVPPGGTADATNSVLWERNLAPGESRIVGEAIAQTLRTGSAIQAKASVAAGVNMVASGYETVS